MCSSASPGVSGGKAEEGLCLPLGAAEASLVPWGDPAAPSLLWAALNYPWQPKGLGQLSPKQTFKPEEIVWTGSLQAAGLEGQV